MAKYLAVGAPVYFVVRESKMDYTDQSIQKKICGGLGCDTDSLITQIYLASKTKDRSYIAATPASWMDDYLDWLRIAECCRIYPPTGDFCPAFNTSLSKNNLMFVYYLLNINETYKIDN